MTVPLIFFISLLCTLYSYKKSSLPKAFYFFGDFFAFLSCTITTLGIDIKAALPKNLSSTTS